MKGAGGALGVVVVVAVLGYALFSGQLSLEELIGTLLEDDGAPTSSQPAPSQPTPSAETAGRQLSELRVRPAGSMAGYSREEFPHWSDAQEYGWRLPGDTPDPESCDARDAALIRDGDGERVESSCYVESGNWYDPYGGQTYTDPADIDVDHMVPLANAWRSGASEWNTADREEFANVPRDLLAVDDGLNQSKGDKGPEAWKPPQQAYWCTYAKEWIDIKHLWDLSITSAEKIALQDMLGRCGR